MVARELGIAGAFEFTPPVFGDRRGSFACPYVAAEVRDALGYEPPLAQVNQSVSARGVLRGVHFADVPPGQSKYVYCTHGSAVDVVVDIRAGSPTFGRHDVVLLDGAEARAVFVPEGLGHAFFATSDDTVVNYLCSAGYAPEREHGIDPLDAELALPWLADIEPVLSDKDRAAPSLARARERGLLPDYAACLEWYAKLRG